MDDTKSYKVFAIKQLLAQLRKKLVRLVKDSPEYAKTLLRLGQLQKDLDDAEGRENSSH